MSKITYPPVVQIGWRVQLPGGEEIPCELASSFEEASAALQNQINAGLFDTFPQLEELTAKALPVTVLFYGPEGERLPATIQFTKRIIASGITPMQRAVAQPLTAGLIKPRPQQGNVLTLSLHRISPLRTALVAGNPTNRQIEGRVVGLMDQGTRSLPGDPRPDVSACLLIDRFGKAQKPRAYRQYSPRCPGVRRATRRAAMGWLIEQATKTYLHQLRRALHSRPQYFAQVQQLGQGGSSSQSHFITTL